MILPNCLYLISRAVRQVKFEIISKCHKWYLRQYQVQILLLFVYTATHKRFAIFTLSWNTTTLSQSNCRNFLHSSIITERSIILTYHFLHYNINNFFLIFISIFFCCWLMGKNNENVYIVVNFFFISGNFYFSFVSTSLAYISIPKNKRKKQKLPEIKKLTMYNIYTYKFIY